MSSRMVSVAELDALRTRHLGGLASVMGVRPWETDRLTIGEFVRLVADLRGVPADA